MKILIHRRNIPLNGQLVQLLHRRLQFALGRFAPRLRRVSVYLNDDNADRGGFDKQCRLAARLAAGPEIVVAATDQRLEVAITRGIDRLARGVSRVCRQRWDPRGQGISAAG